MWSVSIIPLLAAAEHMHHHTADPSSGGFFSNFLQVFVPRQQCMFYDPGVVWLHAVSDGLIALSYFTIPVALVYFVRRRHDLEFSWMYVLFAAFILACGATHAFGVVDIWRPYYRLDGVIKAFTAVVSVAAAMLLWPLLPRALALPSPQAMKSANEALESQVRERRRAEEALRRMAGELEIRVQQRTIELEQVNESLRAEIAGRKAAEEQRNRLLESERAARAEAERASRTKDEFLATLSHELRTPLNAILGWSQLLGTGPRTEEDVTQGLEIIGRNARAQSQLIEDLLDMSRIITGKLHLRFQTLDLPHVIDAALAAVRPAAEAKGIRLEVSIESGNPALVRGDPNRLQQVFWNLLSNAIKFTPRGGMVSVSLRRVGTHIEVVVHDTGRGISPDFLPYMFDRFRQADASTTREHGGLGLGLAIVRNLVELHGGTVEASSAGEGQGATFTVMLPVAALQPSQEEQPLPHHESRHAPQAKGRKPDLRGLNVLVVDDDADARELVRRLLEESGAVVTTAASVTEAMEAIQAATPDLLLSDIGMPGHDGYELIERLRMLPPDRGGNIPAAALTAFARAEDRARALNSGYQTHVSKPVEPNELLTIVAHLAGRNGNTAGHDTGAG